MSEQAPPPVAKKRVPLFRPEAVEHARTQWLGEFRLSTPVSAALLAAFLAGSVAVVVILLFSLQYTRRVTIMGELRTDPGIAPIAASEGGEIQKLFVREGDRVAFGKPLFVVADPRVLDSLSDAATEQLRALTRKTSAVSSGLSQSSGDAETQIGVLNAKRHGIEAEANLVQAEIAAQRRRVELSREILGKYNELAQSGYAADLAVLGRRDDLESKEEVLESLSVSLLQFRSELADVDAQAAAIQSSHAEAASTAGEELASIDQQGVQIQINARSVVRAPVSGTVTGISINVGQHVDPGTVALQIVPQPSRLTAVLRATGEAAGLARVGEPILLRVDAFPYEQFGLQRAAVRSVSRSTIAEADGEGDRSVGDRSFLIYVDLPNRSVNSEGVQYSLKPGMTVTGELLLDRKPLIVWLLGPIGEFFRSLKQ